MSWPVIRCVFGIAGGVALGVAIASLLPATGLSVRWFGVALAISAFCVIAVYAVKAIEKDHARRYRQQVWDRRIAETPGAVRGGQDPDWLFKAPFWQLPSDPFDEVQR